MRNKQEDAHSVIPNKIVHEGFSGEKSLYLNASEFSLFSSVLVKKNELFPTC